MKNKKKRKSLIEEIASFLNYLQINDFSKEKRKSEEIDKKIPIERYYRIRELCKSEKANYIREDKKNIPEISIEGLKFLENFKKEKRITNINHITLFLTTMLVITTIVSFFKGLGTIHPIILTLLYGICAILVWIYFKRSKSIKI